jgi:hypothetical protein
MLGPVSKASERPRKPSVLQLVVFVLIGLNSGVIGLFTRDSGWDLAFALTAVVAGFGYCLYWVRDYRRYRAAIAKLS